MTRRYVYFRMPTGKPYTGNDDSHAPTSLLAEVGRTATADAQGQVSWQGFEIKRIQTALRSAFLVLDPEGEEVNESDAWGIVWPAVVASVRRAPGKPVKPADAVGEADALAAAFFRKPKSRYILVSSLSIRKLPSKKIAIGCCTVSALKERGERFPLPDVLRSPTHGQRFADHLNSTNYRLVKVDTQGRSVYEAIDNALNALNLLRGLWSVFATYGTWSFSLGGSGRKPLGVIHTGPVHTLHFTDGKPAVDNLYWYDPDFTEEQPLFRDEDWARTEKGRRWATRRLALLNYRRDLEALLIRYAVALDQPNPDVAFLQMWGVLEKLTDTVGAKYDETIRRAVWLFVDHDRTIAKEMLESLRYRRNQYVHSGRSGQEADQVAYMVKSFVDPHLLRLIANPFKVSSIEEYSQFLALPTDVSTLEKRRRMLGLALRATRGRRAKGR